MQNTTIFQEISRFQILRQPYVETQVEHSHSCLLVQQEGSHLSYPGESMMHGIRYVEKTRAFTRWYYGKHMCKDMPYSLKRWRPKMPTGGAENTSDGFIMIMIDAASQSRLDCNICVYVYIIIYIYCRWVFWKRDTPKSTCVSSFTYFPMKFQFYSGFNPSEKNESQLGLWHSQLNGKSSNSMVPKHQAAIVRVTSSQISQLVAFTSHSKIKKYCITLVPLSPPRFTPAMTPDLWHAPSLDWDLEVHVARRPPASTFHHC